MVENASKVRPHPCKWCGAAHWATEPHAPMPIENFEAMIEQSEPIVRKVLAPWPGNEIADALWRDLPELVRDYPMEKRHEARIHAYTLFDKFAGTQDNEQLSRLRFVLETHQDVGRELYAKRFEQ